MVRVQPRQVGRDHQDVAREEATREAGGRGIRDSLGGRAGD